MTYKFEKKSQNKLGKSSFLSYFCLILRPSFKSVIFFLFISLTLINFGGCCSYSFTGASIPAHLHTVAIPFSDDRSGSGEPDLKELFTRQLTQKFIDDNSLGVTERTKADAVLETTITSLVSAPAIVTSGESIQTWRVTLTVQVVYRDLVKRKTIYEKSFSNYGDYESSSSLTERQSAIQTAIDRITDDILLETVSGW
jgi:hypothetical protein